MGGTWHMGEVARNFIMKLQRANSQQEALPESPPLSCLDGGMLTSKLRSSPCSHVHYRSMLQALLHSRGSMASRQSNTTIHTTTSRVTLVFNALGLVMAITTHSLPSPLFIRIGLIPHQSAACGMSSSSPRYSTI
jgi:hypothetical protein